MTNKDDVYGFLPLSHLGRWEADGLIGKLADRFHTVPTEYSQRNTVENDVPQILTRCQQDSIDVAILVPV